jgi:hypothetical protein
MLIPTDGRLPQTSQTAAIDLVRIAANAGGPGVGEELRRIPLAWCHTCTSSVHMGWDQQEVSRPPIWRASFAAIATRWRTTGLLSTG